MKNNTILSVKTSLISERKGFNTRYDLGDLRELKANMEENGFNPAFPLIVTPDPENEGKYLLGAQGHRRLTVANDIGLKEVYVVLEDESLSDEDRNLDIIRLNNGLPLTQLEAARVLARTFGDGSTYSKKELGRKIGKSDTYVGDCLKLVATTPATQKAIEKEKISAQQVIDLMTEHKDAEKVETIVEKLVAKAGDKKVTKKTKEKAEKEDEETEDEKAEREEKEKEEAEIAELNKVKRKLEVATTKRVQKFADNVAEMVAKVNDLPADDKLSPLQSALLDYAVTIAAHLLGKGTDTARLFVEGSTSLSDIGVAQRTIEKVAKEALKEEVSAVKNEAKQDLADAKAVIKETKEEAKKRIQAAKAAVAKV